MSELLSVIIPVYNNDEYLSECLVSIIHQSYKNMEIILVDDGSTDDSGKICDEWAEKDERIRVFHKNHEGVSIARNTGMLECKGQLIGFVDADDWLEPEMYELMVNRLIHSDADVVMCGYYSYPVEMDEPIEKGIIPINDGTFEETAISIFKPDGYFTSVWNKIYRREKIFQKQKNVLMDPSLSFGEDEVWLYEVLEGCKCISFLPQALYHYRTREDSLSRGKELIQSRMSIIEAKKKALKLLPSVKSVQSMAKARIYDLLFALKVEVYMAKDRRNYRIVSEFIRPFFLCYIRSSENTVLRKMKICAMGACMRIRMPIELIKTIGSIKRQR